MGTRTAGSAGCSEAWSYRRGSGVQAFCRVRQNLGEGGLCLADQNEIGVPAAQRAVGPDLCGEQAGAAGVYRRR